MAKKTLGIGINGVIRDIHGQFDTMYRKAFIHNDSIVKADEGMKYMLQDQGVSNDEYLEIQRLTDEKITLPVNTYDLLNHYFFDSRDEFNTFFYTDYALEIFGRANEFPRAMSTFNRIQAMGEQTGLFDTVLISTERDQGLTATYQFLTKHGCRAKNVRFIEEPTLAWSFCDVIIHDAPSVFESVPEGKTAIKIIREYNEYSDVKHSFPALYNVFDENVLAGLFSQK